MPTSSPSLISDEPESPPRSRSVAADSPLHPVSLVAGAGSAALAAVIGGQLGLSGTVIGAAVGSIVAAITATTIRTSVHRSRAAAIALARRRHADGGPAVADMPPVEPIEPASPRTPWSGWVRGAVTVGAGFALGIAGLLLLQVGLGRNLSPGTDQLQSAAAKVVVAGPRSTVPHPTSTVTQTVSATAAPSTTSSQTAGPATPSTGSVPPSETSTPSAAPTPSTAVTP